MAGQPPFYKTVQELENAIELYFEELKDYDKDGNLLGERTPTTAGLAYHLGFADRQSLYDQKGRSEEFSCVIKRAILRIESVHEVNLVNGKSPTGSIFWLKNHKWQDTQTVNTNMNASVVDTSKLSPDKQAAMVDALVDIFNPGKDDEANNTD